MARRKVVRINDNQAHKKLKELNEKRGYKNARRDKNERHEKFNEVLREIDSYGNETTRNGSR